MKTRIRLTCVAATLLLANALTLALPACAQQTAESGSGAPLFRLPNFVGDSRVDDLYVYMHEQPHDQWDEYRKRLEAAAGRIVHQQPLHQSPTPDRVSPGGAAFMNMVNGIAGSTGSGSTQSASDQQDQQQQAASSSTAGNYAGQNSQTAQYAAQSSQVSTSVSGAVLLPPDPMAPAALSASMPVPGLISP